MIYAIDFDGTLMINGKPNIQLINQLIQKAHQGHYLILNTCRTGKKLGEAVTMCQQYGLMFHSINENAPHIIKRFGANPRKIYADFYIDDKAISPFVIL